MHIRRLPSILLAALVGVGATLLAPGVHAVTVPPVPDTPLTATVRADVLPAPQINGVVWKQVIAGNIVYAGGEFTTARPFGAAPGSHTTPRSNLLAYNVSTGALDTSFRPSFNGKVADMAVTPDKSKLVVVGNFTRVNGQVRNRVAVFNLPSRTLSSVAPSANNSVMGVAATNSSIFLGGNFSAVNGVARSRVGSVSASTGAVLPFVVHVDNGQVNAIVTSPDGSQVVLGGNFTSVGGLPHVGFGLYRAEATTGTMLPLPVNEVYRNAGPNAGVLRLASDSTSFYGAGYNVLNKGGGGNSEGVFQADWATGSLVTLDDCHGDSYDVAPIGQVYYVASHEHYCGNSGGFPQTDPETYWHSTAWTKEPDGPNLPDRYGYPDHPATPHSQILPFLPRWTVGTYTGTGQATWAVTGNSQYVLYGGEFRGVDGVAQQGIARFAVRSLAPNKSGPQPPLGGSFTPTAQSNLPGEEQVTWPAAWDHDDLTLTYRLFRNGKQVFETSQTAYQWMGQDMTYPDTGLTVGSKVSYVVQALDPDGNTLSSRTVTVTVPGSVTPPKVAPPKLPSGLSAPAVPTPAKPKAPGLPALPLP
jgi:trimeric autotransporter adhesin